MTGKWNTYEEFFDAITDGDDDYVMVTPHGKLREEQDDVPYEEQRVTFLYSDGTSEDVYRKDYEELDLEHAPVGDEYKTARQIMWERFRESFLMNRIVLPALLVVLILIFSACNNTGRATTYSGSASPTPRPTLDASFYYGCNGLLKGKGACAIEHKQWQTQRENLVGSSLETLYNHVAFNDFYNECILGALRQRQNGAGRRGTTYTYFGEHESNAFLGCIATNIESGQRVLDIDENHWYDECVRSKPYGDWKILKYETSKILSCTVTYLDENP